MEAAPRSDAKLVKDTYYRGMKGNYGHKKVGDEILINNYTSISKKKQIGINFMNKNTKCCLYAFHLPKGMPYINMINTTKYKHESEILLPRDIKFVLAKIVKESFGSVYHINVMPSRENQFTIDTGCRMFDLVSIKEIKEIKKSKTTKKKLKTTSKKNIIPVKKDDVVGELIQMIPDNVNENLNIGPYKSKNCNKEYICPIDKICNPATGRCVSIKGALGKKLYQENSSKFEIDNLTAALNGMTKKKQNQIKKKTLKKNIPNTKDNNTTTKKCSQGFKCPVDKVCNPKSGRCILKTGALGKKILSEQ